MRSIEGPRHTATIGTYTCYNINTMNLSHTFSAVVLPTKGSIKHSPKRIKRLLGDCVMRFNIYGSGILNHRLSDGPGMPCSYEFCIL